jgi:hypothetical protein
VLNSRPLGLFPWANPTVVARWPETKAARLRWTPWPWAAAQWRTIRGTLGLISERLIIQIAQRCLTARETISSRTTGDHFAIDSHSLLPLRGSCSLFITKLKPLPPICVRVSGLDERWATDWAHQFTAIG